MCEQQLSRHRSSKIGEIRRQTHQEFVDAQDADERGVANHDETSDGVAVEDVERVPKVSLGVDGDHGSAHDTVDAGITFEPACDSASHDVTIGDDAGRTAVLDDDDRADPMCLHEFCRPSNRAVGWKKDRRPLDDVANLHRRIRLLRRPGYTMSVMRRQCARRVFTR